MLKIPLLVVDFCLSQTMLIICVPVHSEGALHAIAPAAIFHQHGCANGRIWHHDVTENLVPRLQDLTEIPVSGISSPEPLAQTRYAFPRGDERRVLTRITRLRIKIFGFNTLFGDEENIA